MKEHNLLENHSYLFGKTHPLPPNNQLCKNTSYWFCSFERSGYHFSLFPFVTSLFSNVCVSNFNIVTYTFVLYIIPLLSVLNMICVRSSLVWKSGLDFRWYSVLSGKFELISRSLNRVTPTNNWEGQDVRLTINNYSNNVNSTV